MNSNRDTRIDVIKGVAIFLVLWGHSIQFLLSDASYYENPVFRIIYSFHMPLFALMSGYLYVHTLARHDLRTVLLSKVRVFLIPIAVWTTVSWLIDCVQYRQFSVVGWWNHFWSTDLWFIWSILACMIVLAIIEKTFGKSLPLLLIGVVAGAAAMYLFPNPENNLYLYPFFLIGYYYHRNEQRFTSVKKYAWLAIPVYVILMGWYGPNMFADVVGGGIGSLVIIELLRFAIRITGCLTVTLIVGLLATGRWKWLDSQLAVLGRYTLQIYILQGYFYRFLMKAWPKVGPGLGIGWSREHYWSLDLCVAPILSVALAFILVAVIRFITRYPRISRLMFGR